MTRPPLAADEQNRFFDQAFRGQPIMGVFRGLGPDDAVKRATTAWDAGVDNVEIPVETAGALASLEAVAAAGTARGRLVGAGTVVTVAQLEAVARAGAAYTVAPGFSRHIARASLDAGLPHLPGVATASEILDAVSFGLEWLKAFPGSLLGSRWLTAMHGPFPHVRFAVTGGMSASNAREFLEAGARTVAVSAAFDDPDQLLVIREIVRDGPRR